MGELHDGFQLRGNIDGDSNTYKCENMLDPTAAQDYATKNYADTNFLTSPVAIADGGTGQTGQTAAFDALAPTTTKGDIIVHNGSDNIRLAVGANDTVLTADSNEASGVKWAAAAGGGETVLQAHKTSNETMTSDDTMQDDDELTITLAANSYYKFDATLVITSNATPDFQFEWVESDGTYDFHMEYVNSGGTDQTDYIDETEGPKVVSCGTSGEIIIFKGIIVTGGSGGTFKLQWAQNTSSGLSTTVYAGSYMRAILLD